MPLRLVFMGTPDFAVPTLDALRQGGHEIVAVYTQKPRPAGRGQQPRPSPVQAYAGAHGLTVRTPETLRDPDAQAAFAALRADAAVVVAYGLILPKAVLAAPRLGCFNLHASLLPRWRGAAPIQRAILAGDAETGAAVMRMEAGLDTGPVLAEIRQPIGPRTTAGDLHDALAAAGAALMAANLPEIAAGRAVERVQSADGVTYAHKIDKAEGLIDWSRPAEELDRLVRALGASPGVWFEHGKDRIKVLAATPMAGQGAPGTVIDPYPVIACGTGALRLDRLQRAGKAALDAPQFRLGNPFGVGDRLG